MFMMVSFLSFLFGLSFEGKDQLNILYLVLTVTPIESTLGESTSEPRVQGQCPGRPFSLQGLMEDPYVGGF